MIWVYLKKEGLLKGVKLDLKNFNLEDLKNCDFESILDKKFRKRKQHFDLETVFDQF